jgi:hypothetical protein
MVSYTHQILSLLGNKWLRGGLGLTAIPGGEETKSFA